MRIDVRISETTFAPSDVKRYVSGVSLDLRVRAGGRAPRVGEASQLTFDDSPIRSLFYLPSSRSRPMACFFNTE